ncbi:MAG: hypothetical protein RIQ89_807 [Bacteroidota bacterium]|jgi:photosystem II stability/assembly factor-like uncharacterized protein
MKLKLFLSLSLALCQIMYAQEKSKVTSATIGMLEARHIGPAVMGGRITAIDANNKEPRIMYIGTAAGGVWKTNTGGSIFKPIFDKYCQSIGDLVVDQKNPETIWVGTGESNMRNSVSIGNGIYKSTDGGTNWTKMGLDSTEHISRVVLNPNNSNEIYVAAPGPLWSDSEHRGLYKSTDGGNTWQKILYVDKTTGCAEVLIDPSNPQIIYASMWQFRRSPYSFSSGGKNSALMKSIDGGKTWKKLSNGLPTTDFGRIAMNLAPSNPSNLFAIVEAKKTSLYLSTDGGETWKEQSSTNNVSGRPFYFSVIEVDPKDPKRVYRPAWSLSISNDGGLSFTEASQEGGWIHSDHHALWINPNNPSHMYLGTDGGVYMSMDRGNNWLFLNSIPVSQFYHVGVDDASPYNVFGGLQDNGSWIAPSNCIGGITNGEWKNVGFGDGFWVQRDKENPNIMYSEYQGGNASRVNLATNEYADIKPRAIPGDPKLRYNWNTPLVLSKDGKRLYMGAQYLYKSLNKGITWERISPDLTTNDPKKQNQEESGGVTVDNSSAENHCTIFTLAESPFDANVIYVGTDDGNLQLTKDGGKTWINVGINNKSIPAQTWVSSIEPSKYDKNVVYATFDNHAYGDHKTYCCKSTDMGTSWTLLTASVNNGFAHKIKEDLVSNQLLLLGTEFGLMASFDAGQSWITMNAKIPPTPVRDIVIHERTNDLVLATHGRGVLIVDDISPLRQLNADILNQDMAFINTRPVAVTGGHYGGSFPSAGGFVGGNANEQAQIIYYLKDRVTTGDVKVEIFDPSGNFITTIPATKRKGLNIISWNMRTKPPRTAKGVRIDVAGFSSPLVSPGNYEVKITKGDKTISGKLILEKDPLSAHSNTDIALQQKTSKELFGLVEELAFTVYQINMVKDSAQAISASTQNKSLKSSLTAVVDGLENVRKQLIATKGGEAITGEERLREKLSELYASVTNYEGRPSDSQLANMKTLSEEFDKLKASLNKVFDTQLKKAQANLIASKQGPLIVPTREYFDKNVTAAMPINENLGHQELEIE